MSLLPDKLRNKFFAGAWVNDVKHYFTKINEIIDYLTDLASSLSGVVTTAVTDLDPVISQTNTPAGAPTLGDRYLVGPTPTGTWVGNANNIAEWDGAAWDYTTAVLDDVVYITNTLTTKRFNGTSWVAYSGAAALVGGNSVAGTMTLGNNLGAQLNLRTNGLSRFAIAAGGYLRQAAPTYIGSNITTNAHASSILELASTTKGFLPPRMTTIQRNAIATATNGLLVYDTDLNRPMFYAGGSWVPLSLEGILQYAGGTTGGNPITGSGAGGNSNLTLADTLSLSQTDSGTLDIFQISANAGTGILQSNDSAETLIGRIILSPGYAAIDATTSFDITAPVVNISIGATGTFLSADAKTVTVTSGIITSIV